MAVISVHKDEQALTLTFVAEFDAGVERVWQVWEDPRQLERWWGPPTWPATFKQHDFVVGGQSRYHMTGPDGQLAHGWWTMTAIEAPFRLAFDDGFAGEDGEPDASAPVVSIAVTIEGTETGARMTTVNRFSSLEDFEQLLSMGMDEGMRLAMGQIDNLLTNPSR
ncbi:SRPBCC domain-containing protein [Micromonospora polyrhachis]|uniref:Uncharacterized protein YndB with AHSA1/START domain n=1 Tax=Micromonospora polyrhachis TaxID=1282883 RepID=A0A7W7SML6_9ACTN|nr:SRPBCC domain-containing protein [Micromonospora polyrhachis]MBB4957411.1 uncharacterized protein YndB with AHSA1/START domain [Micromonospora polyrhachis]